MRVDRARAALVALLAISALAGSHGGEAAPRPPRRTVVVVPGVTGVELVDSASGEIVWGRGGNLLGPADGGYRLALPIVEGASAGTRPGRAIERVALGPIGKPVYAPVARRFERAGWTRGDLTRPDGGGDLFFFAYDWRRDNSEAARRLARQLGLLAGSRGGRLAVSLVCQSNGAHICRYLLKYGDVALEEAENGVRRPPEGIAVEQVVLVGTANGGSLRILRQLNRTRRYVPAAGRAFHPEVFFTYESLYQELPTYRSDLFVDEGGAALSVDVWDVADWERYGWSIFAPEVAERTARRPDLFGDRARQREFLRRALDRGRRLQALLERDVDVGRTRYHSIQNRSLRTPDRAVLRPVAARDGSTAWETLVTGDRALARLPIAAAVAASGDGHAPAASQEWLSPSEAAAMASAPVLVEGRHFEMITRTATLDRLVEICSAQDGGVS